MLSVRPLFLAPVATLCACCVVGDALAGPRHAGAMPAEDVAPLLADDGSAYPAAQRLPAAERAAGGPAPGWATRAQRDQLQRLHPRRVVRLHAADRSGTLRQTPAAQAWVFVDGDAEGAVRMARRLSDAGVERVWVLLPQRVDSQLAARPASPRSPL